MQGLQDVAVWIAGNIVGQVPILIGLIALVGLLVQRRPLDEVLKGAMRAALGVVILLIGTELFSGALAGVQGIVSSAVGLDLPRSPHTLDGFLAERGSAIALIITLGFLVHVLLVRLFRGATYLYLTGHLMFWMSVVVAATFVEVFGDLDDPALVLAGSVVVGCYWTLQPLWTRPLMRRVTGEQDHGLAHTTSATVLLTGWVARSLGDPARRGAERRDPPRRLALLQDVYVASALVVGALTLAAMAFADKGVVAEQARTYSESVDPWVWGLILTLRFTAGVAILLFGVQMFLAEIVPAFRGIGDRLAPGTRPALDLPTVFPYAATGVLLGFLGSTVSFLLLLAAFAAAGWFVLVPPMIMLFFGGGAGGVFGHAVAGGRGALAGGVLNGVLLAFGQWAGWHLFSGTAPELATLADADWFAMSWLLAGVGRVLPSVWAVPAIAALVTLGVLALLSRRPAREPAPEQAR